MSGPSLRLDVIRPTRARRAGTVLVWTVLVWTVFAGLAPIPLGAQAPPPADMDHIEAMIDTAPVDVDGETLFRVRGATSRPAELRAAGIASRIEAVAADPTIRASDLRIADSDGLSWIMARDRPIMAITEADARLEQLQLAELAAAHVARVRQAIEEYRQARRPEAMRADLRDVAVAAIIAILAAALILLLYRWAHRLMSRWLEGRLSAVQIQSVSIVRAERIHAIVHQVMHLVTGLVLLAIAFQLASFTLGRFPATRFLARQLFSLVVDPLVVLGQGALDQVPNLIFLAVLFLVFRLVLRAIRLVFDAIGRDGVRIPGFEPEWALPTYKIVRFAWIAFGVVIAYPYLPGSQSDAFKGVSIFVGVLFSLGSSSAISNVIAGYTLIYRRAFRLGDRVQIGEVLGDVTESRLQVTRLRSFKNEEIVIPNSTILTSNVVNYSTLARTQGLILHTQVGIGYETPWRQVEAMLLLAAERTPGLLRTPSPFVLQRALADYAVNYELNVYTDRADLTLELYHELHRRVLDVFNEYRVQIMTPSYMADPAQPKVVPSAEWHLAPAKTEPREGV